MTDERFVPDDLDIGGLMSKLSEELGEANAALGKMMRFGSMSVNPLLPKSEQIENMKLLECEMEDVIEAWKKLKECHTSIGQQAFHKLEPRFQTR